MANPSSAEYFSRLVRARRSIRSFLPDPVPQELLDAVLADANWAPSWSNTQPYRIAVAMGETRERIKEGLCESFESATKAQHGGFLGKLKLLVTRRGLPDGDFSTNFKYPDELQPRRVATGRGLYQLLGIGRNDIAARNRQIRRNFEFFGAPVAIFIFVHEGLREFSVLDAGVYLQTLMLSAHAHGLGTCAGGALATWAGPVRREFDVPGDYKLICGLSLGFMSPDPVNQYNPGRRNHSDFLLGKNGAAA